jgi:hypothetical protein
VSDRSLDDFVFGADDDADAADVESADADAVADPTVPTMRWSADGAPCDACGTVVSRRWRQDDAFVCADCKAW